MFVIKFNPTMINMSMEIPDFVVDEYYIYNTKPSKSLGLNSTFLDITINQAIIPKLIKSISPDQTVYNEQGQDFTPKITSKEKKEILALVKKFRILSIREHYQDLIADTIEELDVEQSTWTIQKTEAAEHRAGGTNTPFISTLATVRNIPLDVLVDKIFLNAEKESIRTATVLAEQHLLEADINTATNMSELLAFTVPNECLFSFETKI